MSVDVNYHTHTNFCDGNNSPREMIEYAIALGFTHLGFSGHMDADIHMNFDEYVSEVRKLQFEYSDRIDVFCGVELDNLYEQVCWLTTDYVIGSTHFLDVDYYRPLSIDNTVEDVVTLCNEFYGGDYYKLCRAYYELEAKICDKFPCTFIGHFDLVSKYNYILHCFDEDDDKYLTPAFDAMECLVKQDIPFELNTRQSDRGKFYPSNTLLKRLKELNGKVIISSDAHNAFELNKGFDDAVELLKKCGFRYSYMLVRDEGKTKLKEFLL